ADALHAHDEMALAILDKQGHYALRLKENQPILHEAASLTLQQTPVCEIERQERRKGEIMTRTASVVAAERLETCFPGLKAIGRITLTSEKGRADERLYLLSKVFSADELLDITRSHWAIENNLHWVLDTVFAEDAGRSRKNNAPQNLAIMRRLALNIATMHPE
ncbi:ISAs1 family transposase, partial [Allorhizobium terrae]